ncbi:hypothetical protein [Dishui Lake phycodnavirus 3]|nr:hypothetical protein [Dishui Lake phycodnavirus 3]
MSTRRSQRVPLANPELNGIVSKLRNNLTQLGMNARDINTKIKNLRNSESLNKRAYAQRILNTAKAAKAARSLKRAVRPSKDGAKTTKNNKTLRGRIYQIYNSLRKLNRIDNKRIFNFLFSYYKDADDTFLYRTFGGKPDEFIRNAMIKQYDIMRVNDKSRNAGYVRNIRVEFNDTNLKDFVMMMYLDMYHDKTFVGTLTEFANSGIPSELLGERNLNKLIGDTELKRSLIRENVFDPNTDKPYKISSSPYEKTLKTSLAPIFGLKEPYVFNQSVNLSNYAKDTRKPIYMSIDAESKKSPFSLLITQSKFTNGSTQRKFVKSIISIPNRVDPGNLMPTGGGAQEYNRLFNFTTNTSTRSTQLYDFCDYVIDFHKTKIIIRSRLEAQTEPFYLSINGDEYPLGASAKKGQNNAGTAFKISKFLGDFLQIIVTAKSDNTFVATQDGMCSAMTAFIFKNVLNKTPRLFIEYAFPQGNKFAVYGAENLLNMDPNQNRNVTNILTGRGSTLSNSNNNSNNATSGGTPKSVKRQRASNKTPKSVKRQRLPNIEGSGNSNMNNTTSRGTPKSVKRQRLPNIEGSGNSNMNTTTSRGGNRNNLIANLQKKKLPKYVINGLVMSYDTKQMTANQIIREANKVGKTITMATIAQRRDRELARLKN